MNKYLDTYARGDLKFKVEWNCLKIISNEINDMQNRARCIASRIIGTRQKKGWAVKTLNIKLDPKVNLSEWRIDVFKLDIRARERTHYHQLAK